MYKNRQSAIFCGTTIFSMFAGCLGQNALNKTRTTVRHHHTVIFTTEKSEKKMTKNICKKHTGI